MASDNVQRVLDKLNGVRVTSTGWVALCPAHVDHIQSLSVTEGEDGRVLLHCHAGCRAEAIVSDGLGLAMKDLFPQLLEGPQPTAPRKQIASYEYVDEQGLPLYEVVRYEPKGFAQRRILPGGGFAWGIAGVRKVLFHLDKIQQAKIHAKSVWVVEGEKDVLALEALGLTATTNSGGAGKWHNDYTMSLVGVRGVAVIPDADLPGRTHAKAVCDSLLAAGVKVRLVHLPAPHKDVYDYIRAGATAKGLLDLARAAKGYDGSYNPAGVQPAVVETDPTHSTVWIEDASAVLSGETKPVEYLVPELIPAGTLVLAHGEPRTRKSWFAQELVVASCVGGPVAGLDRFTVKSPIRVLYSSQEDQRRDVAARFVRLLLGRNVRINGHDPTDGRLKFAIHKGIELENIRWQEALLRDIEHMQIRLLVLDPIRRFALSVDKGPAEVRSVTGFLRRLVVETGCSVLIVHHDVKPPQQSRNGGDERRRSHKASGGDWFAACECPISLEPAGPNTIVIPENYKLTEDPRPFMFAINEDPHRLDCPAACMKHKTWVRLDGESTSSRNITRLVETERIIDYLLGSPMRNAGAIAAGTHISRGDILPLLERLEDEGRVDSVARGRSIVWSARPERSEGNGISRPKADGEMPYED